MPSDCDENTGKGNGQARTGQRQPGFRVRPAAKGDFEAIMAIENACFPGELAYSREQMRYLVFRAHSETLVAESGGEVTGYVSALFRKNSRVAGIETIGVAPQARGSGFGFRLLTAAEEAMAGKGASIARLEVSAGNREAIAMYEKAGYRVTGTLRNYYQYLHNGTRDAIRMEKPLGSRIG